MGAKRNDREHGNPEAYGMFGICRLAVTETWRGTAPSEWIGDNLVLVGLIFYPLSGVAILAAVAILWPLDRFAGVNGKAVQVVAMLPAGWCFGTSCVLFGSLLHLKRLKRSGVIKDNELLRDHAALWRLIRVSPYAGFLIGAAFVWGVSSIG